MGKSAASGVAASGAPPTGDRATQVLSGKFIALGVSNPLAMYGPFNLLLWGEVDTALTCVAGNINATVADGTNLVVGMAINSTKVPAGTTIAAIAVNAVTLELPPNQLANAILAGADANASFSNAAFVATIQFERSFDGGFVWIPCGIGGAGQQAVYSNGTAISIVASEPELGVLYRLNCIAYTSGIVNYRMSSSSGAAMTWAVGVPGG